MRRDAVITIRVPRAMRRRLEALARREGRSLSQQVERLILSGLDREEEAPSEEAAGARPLAGLLSREPVPEYGDFRSVRNLLSASLLPPGARRGPARR